MVFLAFFRKSILVQLSSYEVVWSVIDRPLHNLSVLFFEHDEAIQLLLFPRLHFWRKITSVLVARSRCQCVQSTRAKWVGVFVDSQRNAGKEAGYKVKKILLLLKD